jgi:cytochrome c-type biogenesis protein CcmH
MELIITPIVFLLLMLAIVWGHYLRSNSRLPLANAKVRDETNVRLYHEHKAEIEKDYSEGGIDQENYQYLLAELDKSLLQDITENADDSQPKVQAGKSLSLFWPISISGFILCFSFALYMQTGAYQQLSQPKIVSPQNAHQNLSPEQQARLTVKKLQQLTEQEPTNGEAWYRLAQAQVSIGDFVAAINAYDQILQIEGEKADLLGAKAQAMYYQNNQVISEQIQQMIDRALALDPLDASSNILLGLHSFMQQDYQTSINYLQKMIDSGRVNINRQALYQVINDAKSRLGDVSAQPSEVVSHGQAQLVLNVSLSADITKQLQQGDDKTVFVYAIATKGPRMPLAAIKIKLSDLPMKIVLSDANAMTPQHKLSSVAQVNVFAVVSKLGGVGIKSGDFKAEFNNLAVNSQKPIELVIDTLVP